MSFAPMFAALALSSLAQWLQAIAAIFMVTLQIVALIIAYATFRRGSPVSHIQGTQSQEKIEQAKPRRIKDLIRLFAVKDFWPQFVLFVGSCIMLLWQSLSSDPLTRFAVLLMVLVGALSLLCLVWLGFRTWFYFTALSFRREHEKP